MRGCDILVNRHRPAIAMNASDLLALDATRLSQLIARRELSCRELMGATLARIEALNPTSVELHHDISPQAALELTRSGGARCWPFR